MKRMQMYQLSAILMLLFLITCGGNNPPNTPGSPTGPSSGVVDESLSFSTHTTDPNDNDIAYLFDWGDGNLSSWSSYTPSGNSVSQNHSFSSTGTFEVRVKAKDVKDKESGWAPGLQVEIEEANNPPNIPQAPSGPSSGNVNNNYNFTATTTDPDGDNVAYQFDWGDGNQSSWSNYIPSGNSISMGYSYLSEGTYSVKAKARNEEGNESDWSNTHSISISSITNSPPNMPNTPSGSSSGYVDSTYNFSASTTDPDGDNVAYQFDWGDGTYSGWSSYVSSGNSASMEHSYSSEGTYSVKAKAKDENDVESGWSGGHSISVSSTSNSPPNTPSEPSGPDNGYEDSTYSFSCSTTDPDGDNVAYQFDWGDGTYSGWSSYVASGNSISMDHSYSSEGTYSVKAKAKDENDVESGWSNGHSISVSSTSNSPPNTPSEPSGPDNGYEDSTYSFTATTTDPDGDNVAYQFDWGDGTYSGWSSYVSSGNSVSMEHSYSSEGTYSVKAKAKDENEVESGWSGGHSIAVSSTSSWSTKAQMPTPRNSLAIGVVNGKIYAIGGSNYGTTISINEEYDPATNQWTTKTDMPTAREGLSIGVANDKIYAMGGRPGAYPVSVNEVYDPFTDSWDTTKADMPTARYDLAIGVVDGKIYAIGGHNNGDLATNEVYDPSNDQWNTKASMSSGASGFAIGVVNDKIYAIKAYFNREYNPSTNQWTTNTNMPTDRNYLAIGVVNSKIYAIGGTDFTNYFATNEEYDPTTDTWSTKSKMTDKRGYLAIGVVDGKIYVIGGGKGYPPSLSTNEEYDPSLDN